MGPAFCYRSAPAIPFKAKTRNLQSMVNRRLPMRGLLRALRAPDRAVLTPSLRRSFPDIFGIEPNFTKTAIIQIF
jgi:hypothetical protein